MLFKFSEVFQEKILNSNIKFAEFKAPSTIHTTVMKMRLIIYCALCYLDAKVKKKTLFSL